MIEDERTAQNRKILHLIDFHRGQLSWELEKARPAEFSRSEWMSRIARFDGLAADDYADMYQDSDDS